MYIPQAPQEQLGEEREERRQRCTDCGWIPKLAILQKEVRSIFNFSFTFMLKSLILFFPKYGKLIAKGGYLIILLRYAWDLMFEEKEEGGNNEKTSTLL